MEIHKFFAGPQESCEVHNFCAESCEVHKQIALHLVLDESTGQIYLVTDKGPKRRDQAWAVEQGSKLKASALARIKRSARASRLFSRSSEEQEKATEHLCALGAHRGCALIQAASAA